MTAAPPETIDLKTALEDVRASVAAWGLHGVLASAIQEALVGIFSVLLAMLEDFRAGQLAGVAPATEVAREGTDAGRASGLQCGLRGERGKGRTASARAGVAPHLPSPATGERKDLDLWNPSFLKNGTGDERTGATILFPSQNDIKRGKLDAPEVPEEWPPSGCMAFPSR